MLIENRKSCRDYVMMEFPDGVGEEMVLMMPFIPARRNNNGSLAGSTQ